jgi:hypothetical protein
MLQPTASGKEDSDKVLAKAMKLSQHQTAVVILENYTEPRFGTQFRDRGTLWFVGLRNLGYQHIVFLQGKGRQQPRRFDHPRQIRLTESGTIERYFLSGNGRATKGVPSLR